MTGSLVAIVGLTLTLIAAVFGFGMRIGTLTERVETQSRQIESLGGKVDALNVDFNGTRLEIMRLVGSHLQDGGR